MNLPIPEETLEDLLTRAFREDVGTGDVTSEATIPPDTGAAARFIARESGIVAGLQVARRCVARANDALDISFAVRDGTRVSRGEVFGTIEGPARPLLTVERTLLNLMQRMSGIASATRAMVDAAAGYRTKILDTRKTVPGLRALDKWAVRLGGGENHRHGLYDMVLIKENHIAVAGGIEEAIAGVQRYLRERRLSLPVEIETQSLEDVRSAVRTGGLDRILLDNMVTLDEDGTVETSLLEDAVAIIDGRVPTEASGNVTVETVPAIAAAGVDFISSGALTHSVRALDISLIVDTGTEGSV